ncbi:MAG: zf-HC2 domain-containing protein [Mobilitalea sp.]
MKKNCSIVRDLLPLYIDDVSSEESREFINEHLKECDDCKLELELSKQKEIDIKIDNVNNLDDKSRILDLSKKFKKFKFRSIISGIVIALSTMLLVYIAYLGLFHTYFLSANIENIEISNKSDLGNGNIFYCVNYQKGNFYEDVKTEIVSGGKLYTNLLQPIIKRVNTSNNGCRIFQKSEYEAVFDQPITGYYLGTQENSTLIWEEGMDIPEPNEAVAKIILESGFIDLGINYLK